MVPDLLLPLLLRLEELALVAAGLPLDLLFAALCTDLWFVADFLLTVAGLFAEPVFCLDVGFVADLVIVVVVLRAALVFVPADCRF